MISCVVLDELSLLLGYWLMLTLVIFGLSKFVLF